MPRPLLFCLKSGRSVCYSVPDNSWLQGFCIQVPDKEIRKQLEQIIKQQYQEKGMEDPTETDIV